MKEVEKKYIKNIEKSMKGNLFKDSLEKLLSNYRMGGWDVKWKIFGEKPFKFF